MNRVCDMLNRPLQAGDYVVFTNNLYEVRSVGEPTYKNSGNVRIMLLNPSKTTRPIVKRSADLCKVDTADVISWKLTQNID